MHPFQMTVIRQLVVHAAKLPLLYIIIGTVLLAASLARNALPAVIPMQIFDLAECMSRLFFALAALTFCYQFTILLLKRWERHLLNQHNVASQVLSSVRNGLKVIFILAIINLILWLLEPTPFYAMLANKMITIIMIVAVGWIAIQIVQTIELVIYQQCKNSHSKNKNMQSLFTKARILRNIATTLIILITIAAILMSFSNVRNIGVSLLASAGFLTALVGLATQKMLSSLFSGLQLILSRYIKIGDVVTIGSQTGIIEEISFTFVVLKNDNNHRLIVPINQFVEKPFATWPNDGQDSQSSIKLNLDYRIPIEPIRQYFNSILTQSPDWNGNINKCHVSALNESSVQVTLEMSAASEKRLSNLLAEVREKMLAFLQSEYSSYLSDHMKLK